MRWPAVFVLAAVLAGCGESAASAPFDGLPLDGDFTVGVDAPVHVARDRYGVAHILAGSLGDAAFVQGYVTAHDRLAPAPRSACPRRADPDPAGFPRAGDGFTVSRADPGWSDLDFSELAGPVHRLVAEARPGRPITVRWALPGGAIQDRRSPHYRDLLDRFYLTDQLFDAPSTIDDIVAAGESRWVFH